VSLKPPDSSNVPRASTYATYVAGATAVDADALFAITNPQPWGAAQVAVTRSDASGDACALGVFGAVKVTEGQGVAGLAQVGGQFAANAEGTAGAITWGVAGMARGDDNYNAATKGLWGAEFDLAVLGYDGESKYTGTAQNTHGLLVSSGSLRKPQYGFELYAGPNGLSVTTTSGGTLPQATLPVSQLSGVDSRGGYATVALASGSVALVRFTGKSATSGAGNLTGVTVESGSPAGAFNSGAAVLGQQAPFMYGLAFLHSGNAAVANTGASILDEVASTTHNTLETHYRNEDNPLFALRADGKLSWAATDGLSAADVFMYRASSQTLQVDTSSAVVAQFSTTTFYANSNVALCSNGAAKTLSFFGATGSAQKAGYGAPTGTATRTTFATGSVTLSALAEHVKALIDDLTAYGLIGT
jgi:hypothetical protein